MVWETTADIVDCTGAGLDWKWHYFEAGLARSAETTQLPGGGAGSTLEEGVF